jgi:hypothetical protein
MYHLISVHNNCKNINTEIRGLNRQPLFDSGVLLNFSNIAYSIQYLKPTMVSFI